MWECMHTRVKESTVIRRREAALVNCDQPGALGAEHLALLGLACIKGVGVKTLAAMADAGLRFADALAIEEKDEAIELLRRFGARIDGSANADWRIVREQAAERAHRLAESFSADHTTLILRGERLFPTALLDLPSPPHWLFVKGSVDVLHAPSLAVVGTREPGEDGQWLGKFVGACLT